MVSRRPLSSGGARMSSSESVKAVRRAVTLLLVSAVLGIGYASRTTPENEYSYVSMGECALLRVQDWPDTTEKHNVLACDYFVLTPNARYVRFFWESHQRKYAITMDVENVVLIFQRGTTAPTMFFRQKLDEYGAAVPDQIEACIKLRLTDWPIELDFVPETTKEENSTAMRNTS